MLNPIIQTLRQHLDQMQVALPDFVQEAGIAYRNQLLLSAASGFAISTDGLVRLRYRGLETLENRDLSAATPFELVSCFDLLLTTSYVSFTHISNRINEIRNRLAIMHGNTSELYAVRTLLLSTEMAVANLSSETLNYYAGLLAAAREATDGDTPVSSQTEKITAWFNDAWWSLGLLSVRIQTYPSLPDADRKGEATRLIAAAKDALVGIDEVLISAWRHYVIALPFGQLTKADLALGAQAFGVASQLLSLYAMACVLCLEFDYQEQSGI